MAISELCLMEKGKGLQRLGFCHNTIDRKSNQRVMSMYINDVLVIENILSASSLKKC